MDIILNKPVRCFHKAVLDRLHGSLHVHAGVSGDEGKYIIERMLIGICSALKAKRQLIRRAEHFSDICFAEGSINIGQLVIYRLYQSADCFVDPVGDFLSIRLDRIRIDIDGRILQTFYQIQLSVRIAFPHFHTLCFFNGLVFGQLRGRIQPQELFNLEIDADLVQKCRIVRKNHQDFLPLARHHAKRRVIISTLIPRRQDPETDIIVLIGLVRTIVYCLIEGERVSAIE